MWILVIDDHTLFHEALSLLLKQIDHDAIIISAANCEQALGTLTHYPDLDLILLDPVMPIEECLQLLPQLRLKAPQVPIIVLSSTDCPETMQKVIDAGATGFLPKSAGIHEMQNAIHLILDGSVYIPPALLPYAEASSIVDQPEPDENPLTRRQIEVLALVARGLSNKLIARELDLTEGTVKLHVSGILRTLETRNRTEAVREASRRGFLQVAGVIQKIQ